ncbi:MAG: Zn-dependent hydrolase [Thermomicrobiales bacterium]|nr:Zn-dependent hydrolase [Thermomicrobiales bacterium]
MRVNAQRLHDSLRQLAQIGATPGGGVTRLALSPEDRSARNLLRRWMEESSLQVRHDDFGNMTGRRPGARAGGAVVMASHIDSVRQGGRYDGAYGVLAALEVMRTLNDHGVTTTKPLEMVNWTNEEGVRFEPAMLASGGVAGRFTADYVYGRTDRDGARFGEELERIGYRGDRQNRPGPIDAYLELHIEQGPVLEDAGSPVGVVEGIVGITWSEVVVEGHADHAGPSPMPLRRDALVAAARVIAGVDEIARTVEGAVGTVGRIAAEPNVINTIPGKVTLSVDLRHPELHTLDTLLGSLERLAREIAQQTNTNITVNRFWTSEPTPFADEIVAAVQSAADELGIPVRRLWSGAGHDAKYAQEMAPSAMIFARSVNGLSHCEQEHSTPEDLEAGANVLLRAALRLAGLEGERSGRARG